MKKVSCIMPAYNEGSRIKSVLDIVISHPLIDEIIVVDDGSVDNTKEIIKAFPTVNLILHEKNKGKSMAVYTGISKSTGDVILLLDTDLVGLSAIDITNLIEPVLQGTADFTISLRRNTPRVWRIVGFDYESGERVFAKSLLSSEDLEKIKSLLCFGLEPFLNNLLIKNKSRIKVVRWDTVDSPYKIRKYGFWAGVKGDFKLIGDIFRTIGIQGPIYQIIHMSRLRIK